MREQGARGNNPRKSRIFLVAVLLLIGAAAAIGGTLAWLADKSESLENQFVVPVVTPTINESFDGATKSDVSIRNTVASGEVGIDVYIRVALVPTWETEGGIAPIPASLSDLTFANFPGAGWVEAGGYYYHKAPVAPNASTSVLIGSATVKSGTEGQLAGYTMNLQVLAEAIQATETAVKDAWGGSVRNLLN